MKRTLTLEAENETASRMLLLQVAIALREFQLLPESLVWSFASGAYPARVLLTFPADREYLLPKLVEHFQETSGVRNVRIGDLSDGLPPPAVPPHPVTQSKGSAS